MIERDKKLNRVNDKIMACTVTLWRFTESRTKQESICKDVNHIFDLGKVIPNLPSWVRPDMIYHEDTIEIQEFLGSGHYGCVYKGLFRNGKAVYVNIYLKGLDSKTIYIISFYRYS